MLLSVKNLSVGFLNDDSRQFEDVVHSISFDIAAGEVLALVGESGSGKSVSAMSLIRLLPANQSRIVVDELRYDNGEQVFDLSAQTPAQMQAVRGGEIAVIFQDPLVALNPVHRVGKQIEEVFQLHRPDLKKRDYRQQAIALLDKVGINEPEEKYRAYPHQLSGGMRQRVMIAIALAGRPKLLIADEPTTSLDVTIQAQILSLLQDLQEDYGMSILFISHDLAVVRALSDRVAVMYQGQIVETNDTEVLIANPQHEYSKKLLAASRLVRPD
ncbi:MAG: peptide ABC transporter ATP-binding protein [Gammaproteobacteria bacterium]|nr:MAG: peptide ABC transporter ATP-binding protein [Gammaproteobacteria bacterium]